MSADTIAGERPPADGTAAPATARVNGHASPAAPVPHLRIQPTSGWQLINWKELVAYRDLFFFLVKRDVTVRYKQTVLGLGWAVIRPAVTTIIFSVVFGNLAGVPSDGIPYPIFALAALLPWQYFSNSVGTSTASLVTNAGLYTKVYFPRILLPAAPLAVNLVDLGIMFGLLGAMMAYYGVVPGPGLLFLPVLILIMMTASAGIGLWLSGLAVQYRDVKQAMSFVIQLAMYAAPVAWPSSLIVTKFPEYGETLRLIYGLYPMVGVIEGFRSAMLGETAMPWALIGVGALSATVLCITGAMYFKRIERVFADVA